MVNKINFSKKGDSYEIKNDPEGFNLWQLINKEYQPAADIHIPKLAEEIVAFHKDGDFKNLETTVLLDLQRFKNG